MSFRHSDLICISVSGFCFGTMNEEDFTTISLDGTPVPSKKLSREWPPHLTLYEKSEDAGAAIRTHSTYSVPWTFIPDPSEYDRIPDRTPYLKVKLSTVGLAPYEKPDSNALFTASRERAHEGQECLLGSHGPIMSGKTVMDTLYYLEELGESARAAWELYRTGLYHL